MQKKYNEKVETLPQMYQNLLQGYCNYIVVLLQERSNQSIGPEQGIWKCIQACMVIHINRSVISVSGKWLACLTDDVGTTVYIGKIKSDHYFKTLRCCCLDTKLCPTVLRPHGLQPAKLLCPQDFPGNNTGVDYQQY